MVTIVITRRGVWLVEIRKCVRCGNPFSHRKKAYQGKNLDMPLEWFMSWLLSHFVSIRELWRQQRESWPMPLRKPW